MKLFTYGKRILAALVLMVGVSFAASPAASGLGNSVIIGDHGADNPCSQASSSAGCTVTATNTQNTVLRGAVRLLTVVGGIVGVIFVIVGGFKYVTSAGDPGKAEDARNTLIYAIVGLLVLTVASSIIGFVINRL